MRRAAALLHGDVVAAMAGGGDLCCGARDVLLAGVAGVCRRRGAGLGLGRLCCRGGRVRAQSVSWRCCVFFWRFSHVYFFYALQTCWLAGAFVLLGGGETLLRAGGGVYAGCGILPAGFLAEFWVFVIKIFIYSSFSRPTGGVCLSMWRTIVCFFFFGFLLVLLACGFQIYKI